VTKRSSTVRSYPVRIPWVAVGPLAPAVLGDCSAWSAAYSPGSAAEPQRDDGDVDASLAAKHPSVGGAQLRWQLEWRKEILALVKDSQLSVPTSTLGSASKGHRSIDHIAIPVNWDV
jgi:hypothetical protein